MPRGCAEGTNETSLNRQRIDYRLSLKSGVRGFMKRCANERLSELFWHDGCQLLYLCREAIEITVTIPHTIDSPYPQNFDNQNHPTVIISIKMRGILKKQQPTEKQHPTEKQQPIGGSTKSKSVAFTLDTKLGAQGDAVTLTTEDRDAGSRRQPWSARRSIWPRTRRTRRTHTSDWQRDTVSSPRPSLSQSWRPKLSYRSYRSTPSMDEWGMHTQGIRSMMREVKDIQSSTAYGVSPLCVFDDS